jgi:hypothetical protein
LVPGPELSGGLHALPPLGELDDAQLLDVLAAQEQAICALQAGQVAALAEFAGRRRVEDEAEQPPVGSRGREVPGSAAREVAARLTWTEHTAGRRLEQAARLQRCFPNVLGQAFAGRVDGYRLGLVAAGTEVLDDADAAAVDAAIADRVAGWNSAELRHKLPVEVLAVDPEAAARRAEQARRDRGVSAHPGEDGVGELRAVGPAETILAIMKALTLLAGDRAAPGDDRPIDARRFDALGHWAHDVLAGRYPHPCNCGTDSANSAAGENDAAGAGQDAGAGSDASGSCSCGANGTGAPGSAGKPHVMVIVALSTLLGLDDDPAHLDGYGTISAHLARQIARNGVLRRLLTDDAGNLIGVDGHTHPDGLTLDPPEDTGPQGGKDPPGAGEPAVGERPPGAGPPCPFEDTGEAGQYRPGRAMDRFIRLRDRHCTAPGCRRSAWRCDLDHIRRHPDGPTCPCNLHPLCRRHHRLKHETPTSVTRRPDGTTVWTYPTGHAYLVAPTPVLQRPRVRARTRVGTRAVEPYRNPPPHTDHAAADLEALSAAVTGQGQQSAGADQSAAQARPAPDPGPPPF